FGTLLSSQGTDASFVLTLSGFPPGASLRYFVFPTLSDPRGPDFLGAFPVPGPAFRLSRFPFRRFPPYQFLFQFLTTVRGHADTRPERRESDVVGAAHPVAVGVAGRGQI
ncbi:hypothetical protein, partial [Streptomyces sp. NPDC007088]|uniref:hypothetical protein n=1 Tax=Streptomyces sp. NPDC007088 TaxID=3364773 RepID=UPI003685C063